MSAGKTVTFGIRVQAESNADAAADTVENLRDRTREAQEAVKSYSATLRQLRGTTDEVKSAKEKLKGAIEAEKNAISQNALALGKLGTTYATVVREQQKAAQSAETMKEKTRALRDALKVGGDETRRLSAAFDFMDRYAQNSTVALFSLGAAGVFLAGAFAVGVVAAVGAATVALAKFTLETGDTLRTQELQREATIGNTESAKAFGTQIEFLLTRIPSTREELQKLSLEQYRLYDSTRISGQGIVDAFNAVGVASAAMGKEVGGRISEIISRGKNVGRFGLSSFGIGFGARDELQGTGIKSIDVAKQLAKNLNISLKAAEMQLQTHRASLNEGAKAIREVLEMRFAGVNMRRLISLDVVAKKLHDSLVGLVKGVNIEPFLERIDQLARNFDVAYVNGQALKTLLSGIVDLIFGPGSAKGTDFFQEFIDQAIISALEFEIALYKGKGILQEWVDKASSIVDEFRLIANFAKFISDVSYGTVTDWSFKKAREDIAEGKKIAKHQAEIDKKYAEPSAFADEVIGARRSPAEDEKASNDAFREMAATNKAIAESNKKYAGPGADAINAAAFGGGSRLDTGSGAEVSTPSFKRAPAHARGGRVMRPAFGEMFASVAPDEFIVPAPQAKAFGGKGQGAVKAANVDARVEVTLNFPNVHDGPGVMAALSSPDALGAITKVFEDMVRGDGGLTQTPAGQGGV